jgi:hypothetical protein
MVLLITSDNEQFTTDKVIVEQCSHQEHARRLVIYLFTILYWFEPLLHLINQSEHFLLQAQELSYSGKIALIGMIQGEQPFLSNS